MKKKIFLGIIVLAVLVLILIGILYIFLPSQKENKKSENQIEKTINYFSLEEIKIHNTKEDCWLIIDGKVYDVTEFISLGKHPPQIEIGCGKDATKLFNERTTEEGVKVGSGNPHSENAKSLLKNYYIGELK